MSMSRSDDDELVRRRSGWLIPLAVLLAITALSALFLLYYLAPTAPPLFSEQVSPNSSTDVVALEVGGVKLWIPQNYLQYDSARRGGRHREVALFAMLPDLSGWSNWNAGAFADNGPNSSIVYLTIRVQDSVMSERERLERIYLAYVADPMGEAGPFGLTKYAFRPDSGYHREDLFVGHTAGGPVVLRCERLGPDVSSPKCLRDMPLKGSVGVSYRFKRSKLAHWRDIADGVDGLLAGFEKPAQ
ncbi:MAG: hypothetical protein JO261_06655 [Alphaproteobacteria bacterium]|nr:hypothetical protein [Alphaproteobacteria bacterium]MBV9693365.1 hypothetical protein [Alphaproteobacteria bacterium]